VGTGLAVPFMSEDQRLTSGRARKRFPKGDLSSMYTRYVNTAIERYSQHCMVIRLW